jgi:hypothetical protein
MGGDEGEAEPVNRLLQRGVGHDGLGGATQAMEVHDSPYGFTPSYALRHADAVLPGGNTAGLLDAARCGRRRDQDRAAHEGGCESP